MAKDLLFELGTEELPPKALARLSHSLEENIKAGLLDDQLEYSTIKSFATPRRLAFIIEGLEEQQADREEQKLGPAVSAAFDAEGKPTKAAEGFAKSNGISVEELETIETEKGPRLGLLKSIKGKPADELIINNIKSALDHLPIPKRMRWGASKVEFVRPVKWVVLVYGDNIISTEILGHTASNLSFGHRFHAPEPIAVNASNYETALKAQKVLADREDRKQVIKVQVEAEAKNINGIAQISDALLDEVSALVEWPVALTGKFDKRFLDVPAQALISSMVEHQKYFHVLSNDGKLLPNFITVSNIETPEPEIIINGNERVIRPRLSDAAFFFETDKKQSLASRRQDLKKIIFQKELGSVYEKTRRISEMAAYIARQLDENTDLAKRAGELAKSDLVTEMVLEFPELQGLMGYHYALNDGEDESVAQAIVDHYYPKGESEQMPACMTGNILALADRIDTLVGIFAIGQQPTGNKDPFALRRAALGILRLCIENQLDLDLADLYRKSFESYGDNKKLDSSSIEQALNYTIERFRAYYKDRDYPTEIFLAVSARNITNPLDFDKRAKAVFEFSKLDESEALAAANKRVANILSKQETGLSDEVDIELLEEQAEQALYEAISSRSTDFNLAMEKRHYADAFGLLATLKSDIDAFFDHVMVMAENEKLRQNRIALLYGLRQQFLQIADISLLVKK